MDVGEVINRNIRLMLSTLGSVPRTKTECYPSFGFANPPLPTPPPASVFTNAAFTYDGDGKRVKSDITTNLGTTTTYFVGNHYEVTEGVVTKYYYAGSQRIAMRDNGTLFFLLGDHLGSTSLVTFGNGNVVSETRYKAWGEVRYASGTTPTDYTYTGQYSDSYINLLWYGSRHYDPELGRFIQPDSIVPNPSNPQAYDHYAYTFNNPLRYVDPDGHFPIPIFLAIIAGAFILSACDSAVTDVGPTNTPATPEEQIQHYISNKEYQSAIDLAIDTYDLDTTNVNGEPRFDSRIGPDEALAITDPDGTVRIGVGAFMTNPDDPNGLAFGTSTPGWLGSIIGHEIVHANQIAENRSYYQDDDPQVYLLNEYEAYTWELDNADRFDLRQTEINAMIENRDRKYRQMDSITQQHANNRIWRLPK